MATNNKENTSTMQELVVVLLMCVMCVDSGPCFTNPVAEESTPTITRYVQSDSLTNRRVQWTKSMRGIPVTVINCDLDKYPACADGLIDGRYSSDMTRSSSDGKYKITLTIQNVNRLSDQTTWTWNNTTHELGQCDLDVYSFKSDPVCENIGTSTTTVAWVCTVPNVYPDMDCRFEYRKGNSGGYVSISQDYIDNQKTTEQGHAPPRTTYHDYTCTLDLPISQLSGSFVFQFRFKAVVVSGSKDLETKSSDITDVTFESPEVELSDCPYGYIKEGDNSKTCLCRLKEPGNPPGVAQWLNSQAYLVANDFNSEAASLPISYNSNDKSPSFTCRGYSSLGVGNSVDYSPIFAYGPSTVSMSLHDNSSVVNKFQPDTSFTMYCDVGITSVNPKPTVIVTASGNSIITKLQDTEAGGFYKYNFMVIPKEGGILTMTCVASNTKFPDLKTEESKNITVRDGPINMSLHNNSGIVNKCQPDTSFTMYCDIRTTTANPKPTVTVTASDDSVITELQDTNAGGFYRYNFKIFPKEGGILTMTCLPSNTEFPELKTDDSKNITIQEPPPSGPVITVNNGQPIENNDNVIVTSGDTIEVKCRADGGYPKVNEVTIACGTTVNTSIGIESTQTINVEKENNNMKCTCQAVHVSHCYDKTLEFTLNVLYTPTVTSYKANSESSELTVSVDDIVIFVCNVEGVPIPDVSVRGQRSNDIVTLQDTPSGSYIKRSQGTKKMSCKDTDVYTCMADNGIGSGMTKDVSVFVKCAPKLAFWFGPRVQEYKPLNGTYLKIEIPIIGYPEPKVYSLKQVTETNKSRRKRDVTLEDVDSGMYMVTYKTGTPPQGAVILLMFGLTSRDTGQYVLNIDNGIKPRMDYTFIISFEPAQNSGSDKADSAVIYGTGIGVGAGLLVLGCLCFFIWRKVKKNRQLKQQPEQQPQQQPQQQHNSLQQQQRQQHYQTQISIYEEICLDDYDTLNTNDIVESRNRREMSEYLYGVPQNMQNRWGVEVVSIPDPVNQDVNRDDETPDPRYINYDLPVDATNEVSSEENYESREGSMKPDPNYDDSELVGSAVQTIPNHTNNADLTHIESSKDTSTEDLDYLEAMSDSNNYEIADNIFTK